MTDNITENNTKKGIDIRQALEILSARGESTAGPLRAGGGPKCGCCEKPPNFASLGQTINLIDTDEDEQQKATLHDIEVLKKKVDEERAQRRNELEAKLGSLNKEELMKCFFEVQQQRVQAYRLYDQGLERILESGKITDYPSICTEITATFSVLSDSINNIRKILLEKLKQTSIANSLSQLQDKERTKLNLTAALHLERIRIYNQQMELSDESKDRVLELLMEGAASLRSQMRSNIEEINEIMDDLRCSLVDE